MAAYLGLVPLEDSSGGRRRLGHITKQGNTVLRGLLVEAAPIAVRQDPQCKRKYMRLAMKKNRSIAAVLWPAAWLYACGGCGSRDSIMGHERVPFACRVARVAQWGVVDPRRVD